MLITSCCHRVIPAALAILGVGAIYSAAAQPQADPFVVDDAETSESFTLPHQRTRELEQRFRESEGWAFYHSLSDLPADMCAVLFDLAGLEVVGPGESFDVIDIIEYPGNTQHLYTAVTEELGVVVWYSGGVGLSAHAAIYDRQNRDGIRYNIGDPGVIRLQNDL